MKPVLRFRVRPENRSLYAVVNVWASKGEMIAYFRCSPKYDHRSRSERQKLGETGAMFSAYSLLRFRGGFQETMPIFGEFNFHTGLLNAEVVAHEAGHAALAFAKRVKLDLDDEGDGRWVSRDEERFCYALGQMVNQISIRLTRAKLW